MVLFTASRIEFHPHDYANRTDPSIYRRRWKKRFDDFGSQVALIVSNNNNGKGSCDSLDQVTEYFLKLFIKHRGTNRLWKLYLRYPVTCVMMTKLLNRCKSLEEIHICCKDDVTGLSDATLDRSRKSWGSLCNLTKLQVEAPSKLLLSIVAGLNGRSLSTLHLAFKDLENTLLLDISEKMSKIEMHSLTLENSIPNVKYADLSPLFLHLGNHGYLHDMTLKRIFISPMSGLGEIPSRNNSVKVLNFSDFRMSGRPCALAMFRGLECTSAVDITFVNSLTHFPFLKKLCIRLIDKDIGTEETIDYSLLEGMLRNNASLKSL